MKALKPLPTEAERTCKGLIFRYTCNTFINAKGELVQTSRMMPRKKLSCRGCEACGGLMDDLQEHLSCGSGILGLDEAEHGQLYSLQVVNVSTDYETGIVDGWDLKFVEVEDCDD